jgi:hypothetical protein
MKPFIGYHSFHGCGKISPTDAYSRTQHAMSLFTDRRIPSHRAFMLDLKNEQAGPLEPLFQNLCVQFGPASNTMRGIMVEGGPDYRTHYWKLSADQFKEAFSLLESAQREIPLARERAYVQAFWSFKFVDPETGLILPDQESMPVIDVRLGPGSSLNLSTGKKTFVNAWFLFPFENPSQEFDRYVSRLQKELIFKFSPKHWRLWKCYPARGWWPKKFVPSRYASSSVP